MIAVCQHEFPPLTRPVVDVDDESDLIRRAQQVHATIWSTVFGGDLTGPQYAVMLAVAGLVAAACMALCAAGWSRYLPAAP